MEKLKLIIDTDIGDDVDDALALALALNSRELDLIGITTSYGDTAARARIAYMLLEAYGRTDVRIVPGCGGPAAEKPELPLQYTALNGEGYEGLFADTRAEAAAEFMVESAKRYPGLTIAVIGAMTNVAMAIKMAPEAMSGVRIAAMGGSYQRVYPEWNIVCDPEAAKTVFESGNEVVAAGLDLTAQLRLTARELSILRGGRDGAGRLLGKMVDLWLARAGFVVLHDVLPVAYLLEPGVLTLEESAVDVELESSRLRGLTYRRSNWWGEYERGSVKVAVAADMERCKELFFRRVFGAEEVP